MNPEKCMTIDEALFRWTDLDFSSWITKDKNGNPITLTFKIEGASDLNPHKKGFSRNL
jgi:hypothetical protein